VPTSQDRVDSLVLSDVMTETGQLDGGLPHGLAEFEVAFIVDGREIRQELRDAVGSRFEDVPPVRRFPSWVAGRGLPKTAPGSTAGPKSIHGKGLMMAGRLVPNGAVADRYGVPATTLRYWEDTGLLPPQERSGRQRPTIGTRPPGRRSVQNLDHHPAAR
jgi:MerR family regulatory protein